MPPGVAADELAELRDLRATLLREYGQGRRQRLYPALANAGRRLLEATLPAGRDEVTRVAAYLLLQAVVTHAARRSSLAGPLAAELGSVPGATGRLAEYLEVEVGRVYAETQLHRAEMHLPPPLRDADTGFLARLAHELNEALHDLPAELWEALLRSSRSGRRGRGTSELAVVVPWSADGVALQFPAEVAAATPGAAVVVDARAEPLSLDETVAAVFGARPSRIALSADAADEPRLRELLQMLHNACPEAVLVALKPGATARWLADWPAFQAALDGPPFMALDELLRQPPRGLVPAGSRRPFPDVSAWPLACYRRGAADADILLPVAGRRGAALAADLTGACRHAGARVRLLPGLATDQATDLATALAHPAAPAWSLALDRPELPGDPQALRRAGLTEVELCCGSDALALELVPVIAGALRDVGLQPVATVDTTGWTPAEAGQHLATIARCGLVCVTWRGPLADGAAQRWRAMGGAA